MFTTSIHGSKVVLRWSILSVEAASIMIKATEGVWSFWDISLDEKSGRYFLRIYLNS